MKIKLIIPLFALALILGACAQPLEETEEPAQETAAAPSLFPSVTVSPSAPPTTSETPMPAPRTHKKRALSLPLTADKSSFSVYALQNPLVTGTLARVEDNEVWREVERRTGVELDIETVHPDDTAGRYRLIFSGRETPDLVQGLLDHYPGTADAAIFEGVVVDLAPYLAEYMPNLDWYLHREGFDIRAALTDAGALAAIPRILEEPCANIEGVLIRADWLRELELPVPVTYGDYLNVLREFKEHYDARLWLPEIGDTPHNGFSGGFGTAAWLSGDEYPFFRLNGSVAFGPGGAEYGEYLAMLSMWYEEGLLYEEPVGDYPPLELVKSGEIGVFMSPWQWYDDYAEEVELVGAPAPVRNEGDTNHFIGDYGRLLFPDAGFSVTGTCEDIPLLLQTLDYRYSDEGAMLANYGRSGETFYYSDSGPRFSQLVIPPGSRRPSPAVQTSFLSDPGLYPEYQHILDYTYSDTAVSLRELWSQNRDNAFQLPLTLTLKTGEIGRFGTVMAAVSEHVSLNSGQFIRGERSLDELPDFARELREMGLDFCVELMQQAYERWLGRQLKVDN